jgi:uncharacterized protein with PIN domain
LDAEPGGTNNMSTKPVEFVIDTMLGRLAKWLRIMGIDAHYQSSYKKMEIECLLKKGRILLTGNRTLKENLNPSILICSDKVQYQLMEIKKNGLLPSTDKNWFKRCIRCNIPLQSVDIDDARGRIPEYIISQNIKGIQRCPSCNRYFWPGSHRERMLEQIKGWGISGEENTSPPAQSNETHPFETETTTCD